MSCLAAPELAGKPSRNPDHASHLRKRADETQLDGEEDLAYVEPGV